MTMERPTELALTATSSPPVREEITELLDMRDQRIMLSVLDRTPSRLSTTSFREDDEQRTALLDLMAASPLPGLVYAATRKRTEEIATALAARGIPARADHAGMSKAQREEVQSAFMDDAIDVVVATTAFGMGI